jgi:hypothetical protein
MAERHDPFDDVGDMPAFNPRKSNREKPDQGEVEKIAEAAGFDNRAWVKKKEKLEPLVFKLKASEVQRFRKQALQEMGGQTNPYGAYAAYLRKIWKEHEERAGY